MDFCAPASKSLGNKRNDIRPEDIEKILSLYREFRESDNSKVFDNEEFGRLTIVIEQPKRDENGNLITKEVKYRQTPQKEMSRVYLFL